MESHFHNRSQVSIGVQIFLAFLKLRLKQPMFYVSYIVALVLPFILYGLPNDMSYLSISNYYDPYFSRISQFPKGVQYNIYRYNYIGSNEIEEDRVPKLFVYPNTDFAIQAVNSCFYVTQYDFDLNEYIRFDTTPQGTATIKELESNVRNNMPSYGFILKYDLDKMDMNMHTIHKTDYDRTESDVIEMCMMWFMANYTGNNISTNFGKTSFRTARDVWLTGSLSTSLLFHFAYPMILLITVISIFELNESKLTMLLKISGARRFTLWFPYLMVDVMFQIIYIFIVSAILSGSSMMKHVNYGIIFFNSFFVIIATFAQVLFFSLFFPNGKSKYLKYLLLLFLAIAAAFACLVGLDVMIGVSNAGKFAMMAFFPQLSSDFILQNIEYAHLLNVTLSFSNIKENYLIESDICILFMFISFLIYFVLYMVISNRDLIFNLGFWKKLFCKRKELYVESDNISEVDDNSAIRINNISKTYKSQSHVLKALDDVSFNVDKGEVILLIGPNGSGKTTLISAMTGMIDADCGSLDLFGERRYSFSCMQDYIGVCTQENIIFEKMSVYENLHLFGAIRGCPEDIIQDEIEKLAHSLYLDECLSLKAGTLSGGQKRKLCIAIAFIGDPPIVILDEPTSGIDVSTRQIIWKTISAFSNTTSFVTSHSLEEAESVSSRIFVMSNGHLIFKGTSSELRQANNCGYLFKIIGDNVDMDGLLAVIQEKIPGSSHNKEREDIINIPVCDEVANLLEFIDSSKEKFNLSDYTMTAEAIEDVLLRLISADEN